MKTLVLILAFLAPYYSAEAQVKVAFFKLYNWKGHDTRLEENGNYGHVAISYKEGWLHAHPSKGVQFTLNFPWPNLEVAMVLTAPDSVPELTEEQVAPLLNLPYDPNFSWESENSTYCAKLVAKLLNVEPETMLFRSSVWDKHRKSLPVGSLGLSPDNLAHALYRREYEWNRYTPESVSGRMILGSCNTRF